MSAPAISAKLVEGWWCPCVGPGVDLGHHASECARRVRIASWVPTVPGWTMPKQRGKVTAGAAAGDDAGALVEVGPRPPIVACRPVGPADPVPPAAARMLRRIELLGRPVRLTYAAGWGKRKQPVAGADGKRHFEPWPIESVALRAPRLCAVAWVRPKDAQSWTADAAYAVWGGRIWPVGVKAIGDLLASIETDRANGWDSEKGGDGAHQEDRPRRG